MKHDLPVFALLIDADNVSKEAIAPIIEEITRHARIAVRRVYGDFTTPHLAGWRETLANHGIHPIQQYRNSTGKNSSDSALIIDAMDLLHSKVLTASVSLAVTVTSPDWQPEFARMALLFSVSAEKTLPRLLFKPVNPIFSLRTC